MLFLLGGITTSASAQGGQNPNHVHVHDTHCGTMEMDAYNRQQHPNRGTLDEFERWFGDQVAAYKQQVDNGYRAPLLTVPVIFHIITDGAGNENLSAAVVQAQLDQLNLDFRDQAGSTDAAKADIEMEFCLATLDPSDNVLAEPGINRVTTYGDGPFTSGYIDGTVKPATQWNPNDYMNIWVAPLSGGLLGWAQFPDNSGLGGLNANGGNANTDGVVVGSGTVGSVANPGYAPPYNLGRTLTHEVGHWVGLRHIWGDANCGNDFCGDTPESQTSNSGCPNQTTCDGNRDMVENYMDYTNDACMNVFSNDQKTRIRTVMSICPRRMSLPNSTKCGSTAPTIGFASGGGTVVTESSDCNYQDVVLDVNITSSPSANATVTFSATGTATNGSVDYEFMPASVVFPAGSTPTRQVTVRIYNDGMVEGVETILMTFNVTTTGDAIAATGDLLDHDITINDDDVAPTPTTMTTLVNEDFESGGLGTFTTQGFSAVDFVVGNLAALTSANWTLNNTNTTNFAYTNDDGCNNCNKNNDRLTSAAFSLAGAYTVATLTFDHAFADINGIVDGVNVDETGEVQINTGGGWNTIMNLTNTSVGAANDFYTTPWQTGVTVNLTPYIGQANVQIRFRYRDGNEWAYGMAVDNVVVTAGSTAGIQTTDNTGAPRSTQVNGMQTVHFYDVASNDVMGTIQNLSGWNYQCTRVEVDRDAAAAGAPTAQFWDNNPANAVAAKTFFVDPNNNTPTGSYTITLYYTEAEIAAWEAATGKNRSVLKIIKVSNNPINTITAANYAGYTIEQQAATIGAFGTDVTLTATFNTGFSGFAIGDIGPQPVVLLPMQLIDFTGAKEGKNIKLNWETEQEIDVDFYTLEKSADGVLFEPINKQFAVGNGKPSGTNNYDYLDTKPFIGENYYRLGQVDKAGNQTYSKIVAIMVDVEEVPVMTLAPNPVHDNMTIDYNTPKEGKIGVEIYDAIGQEMMKEHNLSVDKGNNSILLNLKDFPSGMYILRVGQGGSVITTRFIKK